MKNNFTSELVISVLLIASLIPLVNPFDLLMPLPTHMLIIAAFAIFFIIFAVFVWREKAADEREGLHRFIASRTSYLAGTSVLVVGVIVQSIQHQLDVWVVGALAIMILAKIIGLIYGKLKY